MFLLSLVSFGASELLVSAGRMVNMPGNGPYFYVCECMAPHAVTLNFTWNVVAANCLPSSGLVGTLNGRLMGTLKNDDPVGEVVLLVGILLCSVVVNLLNGLCVQPLLQSKLMPQNGLKLSTVS